MTHQLPTPPQLRLKTQIILAFLLVGFTLVIGYSLLSANYFMRGMDNITHAHMVRAASHYLEQVPQSQRSATQRYSGYFVTENWEDLPSDLQKAFAEPPQQERELYKYFMGDEPGQPDQLYMAIRYTSDGHTLFVADMINPASAPQAIADNGFRSLKILMGLALLIVIALLALLWWLVRRVSRPVTALGDWASQLDAERLKTPPPDFGFPELNELAGLIHTSLNETQQVLDREQRFLSHASHELRTPISVIRNNLQLLRKMQQTADWTPRHQQAFARLERAGATMKHLTETLLWLSRDSQDNLANSRFQLDELIQELIDEHRSLVPADQVTLHIMTTPHPIELPAAPVRIVLSNLIRNAFIHCREGDISIYQNGADVIIENSDFDPDDDSHLAAQASNDTQQVGFGLGLQLIKTLTARLGWQYRSERYAGRYLARVNFH